MQFGSVAFFKVLIKTVLCILFFVPLVLCVIFAVMLWNKGAELDEVRYNNEKLSYQVELLSGGKELSVEEFYQLYTESGLDTAELAAYIESKTQNPQGGDKPSVGSGEGVQKPVTNEADAETADVVAPDSAEPVSAETAETEQTQEVETVQPASPYEAMYEDMTVRVPAAYKREEGTVYLTFDDGPSKNTYSMLYYLEKYNIKATFFVVPQRTEECYAIMKQIVDQGHSIGVHSYTHEYETIYASVEAYLEDFYNAWQMIYEATGVKTEIFRFPGGSINDYNGQTRDAIIEEMTRRGFRFYDWNVDSNDAGGATWTEMYNSVPADIAGNYRSVVLFHDSLPRENTVYVMEDIIKLLINEGYKFDKINNDTQPVQFIGPYA